VPFVSFISSSFVMKIETIAWEAWEGNVIDRPLVLAVWPLQKRTNFTQDEVTTLEETSCVL